MKEYLKYNQNAYIYKDQKKYAFFYLVPLIFIFFLLIYSLKKDAYNVQEINAEVIGVENDSLSFYYPIVNGFYYDFIKINEKKYQIEDVTFGNTILDSSNVGMQNITLKVKEYKGKQGEFVKLQIFKNKEKLLKKIAKIIKER